jgi:hypothetical protein
MTTLHKIEWHPWFTNPLDMLDSERLRAPDGKKVRIQKHTDFRVYFDDVLVYSGSNDNSACCAFLRDNDVGQV